MEIAADCKEGPREACCAVTNADVNILVGVSVPVRSSLFCIMPLNGVPLCPGGTICGFVVLTVAAEGNGQPCLLLWKCDVEKIT